MPCNIGLKACAPKSLPQVTLRGEYSYLQDRYQVPEGIASGGVGVSWNLFDGGRNRFEARNLSEQAEAIRCRHEELESVIALDVRCAWLDVQETRRRLETTPEAIRQAEENLRVVHQRYRMGMATNTEVLEAETLRTQAWRNQRLRRVRSRAGSLAAALRHGRTKRRSLHAINEDRPPSGRQLHCCPGAAVQLPPQRRVTPVRSRHYSTRCHLSATSNTRRSVVGQSMQASVIDWP